MLTRPVRATSLSLLVMPALLLTFAFACEKVPLLAPTGSTITLNVPTNVVTANGAVEIIATVLESAGTPPHSGTEVTFTTNLGTIQPATAKTDTSGRAIAKFFAGTSNGTASISASSGAASTGTNGAVKISVGTAAVGRVSLSANPQTISASGGAAIILANVVDLNGNALTSVPVSFSTSAGTLTNSAVNTDASGNAQTTLVTSTQATVTATVGVQSTTPPASGTTTPAAGGSTTGQATATVTVNVTPLPTVSITAPTGTLTALTPVVFTITATPGTNSTAQIRDVTIDFGDGSAPLDLGATSGTGLTVQHVYNAERTYTVRVTVLDSLGSSTSAATAVVIQAQAPRVTIDSSRGAAGVTVDFTFTARVIPSDTTVVSYFWNFGDGTTQTTSSNVISHTYTVGSGTKTVSVTVTTPSGQQATSSISVVP